MAKHYSIFLVDAYRQPLETGESEEVDDEIDALKCALLLLKTCPDPGIIEVCVRGQVYQRYWKLAGSTLEPASEPIVRPDKREAYGELGTF